ncbi:hypothetical protein NTE_03367 [Candidatus Nitrososphaera evergladensis SR1]|uniref:Uncharacterized protein n=1 Tax=Candidatus Nitrososphaera evergladensis SR1 TaxID=1459636 RepID=A0A075MVW3_9ARCH|nr:hypothetical protein [Candidatus Nitrososphaera evergladensis]AIF85395.1 hypothetical protein NTE_03367 [Candidatus Nitrososphaera evergladensis SR1]
MLEAPATESKPNEIRYRTGIPTLTSFENNFSDSIDYYKVKEGQYSYLDRAIQKGTTLLSNTEMDEYFKTFSDKGYKFAVTSADGIMTRYYTINYFEPPISLSNHNVLISILDKLDSSRQDLSQAETTYLSDAINRPYRWTQIGDSAASDIVKRISAQSNEFNVPTSQGEKTMRIMYIGPFSEELRLPEFQAMYGQITASTGGQ